jgi:hypothetical protein
MTDRLTAAITEFVEALRDAARTEAEASSRAPDRLLSIGEAADRLSIGRPPAYCSIECRREMARRRRDLGRLEAELVEARERLRDEAWRPGRTHFWTEQIKFLQGRIAEERQGVAPPLRPGIAALR